MTIRIEAGKIEDCGNGEEFRRWIEITDDSNRSLSIIARSIYAKSREELEVVDRENFQEE